MFYRPLLFIEKDRNQLHTQTGWAYARLINVGTPGRGMSQDANPAVGRTLPPWLDGQTIAIIGTVLTVGIGIGAMVLASTSAMRAEMNGLHARIDDVRKELTAKIEDVRKELGAQIEGLDARVRVVEQSMDATRVGVPDLQARVRGLEAHVQQPAEAAHPPLSAARRLP